MAEVIEYAPVRKGHSLRIAFAAALLGIIVHHWLKPHGVALEAPQGTEILLTRTAVGWIVETRDPHGKVVVTTTTKVSL